MNFEEQMSAERLYKEVLERFPEIKPYEISLHFQGGSGLHASMAIDRHMLDFQKKVSGVLIINELFHKLSNEEKKELIAHEIGHYKRVRKKTPEKIKKMIELEFLCTSGNYRYLRNRNKERFVKWYMLKEMDADNCVLEAFPGRAFLQHLKTNYKEYAHMMNKELKQVIEARIANLEEKISEKEVE